MSNPIGQIGISISSDDNCSGKILINYLDINGSPNITFKRPDHINLPKRGVLHQEGFYGQLWKKAWVKGCDKWEHRWTESFRMTNNIGRGVILTGSSDWKDYTVTSKVMFTLVSSGGIIARAQGLKRYYSLEFTRDKKLRIIKMLYDLEVLKEVDFNFEFFKEYELSLTVSDNNLKGYINGKLIIEAKDNQNTLLDGMTGFIAEDGTISSNAISIS